MSFKLNKLTTERAGQIRRGVVSGKILMNRLNDEGTGLSDKGKSLWLALKLSSYIKECESYLEREALHRTVSNEVYRNLSWSAGVRFFNLCAQWRLWD